MADGWRMDGGWMADGWRMDGGINMRKSNKSRKLPLLRSGYTVNDSGWMSDKRSIIRIRSSLMP
jgi:hypothetical protein